MLGKIRSLLTKDRHEPRTSGAEATPTNAPADLIEGFPPMVTVRPQSADNDDLIAPLYQAVERELQQAGLLNRRQG